MTAPSALLSLAMAQQQSGQLAAAITSYHRHLRDVPGDFEAQHLLALAYFQQQNLPTALGLAASLYRDSRGNAVYGNTYGYFCRLCGRLDEAIAVLEPICRQHRHYPQPLFNLALAWREHGDTAKAKGLLRRALSQDPRFVDAYLELAALLAAERADLSAAELARQATEVAPQDARPWLARLRYLKEAGAGAEIAATYEAALTALPGHADLTAGRAAFEASLIPKPAPRLKPVRAPWASRLWPGLIALATGLVVITAINWGLRSPPPDTSVSLVVPTGLTGPKRALALRVLATPRLKADEKRQWLEIITDADADLLRVLSAGIDGIEQGKPAKP